MIHPKLAAALEQLWRQSRFTSFFFQSIQCTPEDGLPTLALTVSRGRGVLLYNESFFDQLGRDELIGLLAHEMLHVVLAHDHRAFPGEDLTLQNLAQDMAVNSYLAAHRTSFFSRRGDYEASVPRLALPPGLPAIPAAFHADTGIRDPTWEDLYRWLRKQPRDTLRDLCETRGEPGPALQGGEMAAAALLGNLPANPLRVPTEDLPAVAFSLGNLKGVAFRDRDDEILPTGVHLLHGPRDLKCLESQRDRILSLASADHECRQERAWQDIKGIIEAAAVADISSWRRRLRSLIDYSSQSREWVYTYGRLNRRYSAGGLQPPGRRFREQELLTVAVDVSASMVMRPENIEAAFGVVEELLGKYRVHLVCIDENLFIPAKRGGRFVRDSGARRPYVYQKGDWRLIETGSSGTTFFAPLFNEHLPGHHELVLVITDGEIYDLPRLRKYTPTVWVIPEDRRERFEPPFGRVVTMRPGRPGVGRQEREPAPPKRVRRRNLSEFDLSPLGRRP
jgi:predicted metal-dependent peptidase